MADVTLIDVLRGAISTWNTSTILKGIVPIASLYMATVPEGTPLPYALIKAEDISNYFGGTEYYSGVAYKKAANVTFEVYALATGTAAPDWAALAEELNTVMNWSASNPAASWIVPNATKVLSAVREIEAFEPSDSHERIDGVDIMMYSIKIALTYQAQRGA